VGAPLAPVKTFSAQRRPLAFQSIHIDTELAHECVPTPCQVKMVSTRSEIPFDHEMVEQARPHIAGKVIVADPSFSECGIAGPRARPKMASVGGKPHQPFQDVGNLIVG
jgi:hypothetical protein